MLIVEKIANKMKRGNIMFDSVRALDPLGRVCLPKEMRDYLNLKTNDLVLISCIGNTIRIQHNKKLCGLCGTADYLKEVNGKIICRDCEEMLKKEWFKIKDVQK